MPERSTCKLLVSRSTDLLCESLRNLKRSRQFRDELHSIFCGTLVAIDFFELYLDIYFSASGHVE